MVRSPTAAAQSTRATAAGGFGAAGQADQRVRRAATWSPPSATSTATAATTWSRAGSPTARLEVYRGDGAGGFRRRALQDRWAGYDRARGHRRPRRRRPPRPGGPGRDRPPLAGPRSAVPPAGHAGAAARLVGPVLHDHRLRRLQRRRPARPAGVREGQAGGHLVLLARATAPSVTRWPGHAAHQRLGVTAGDVAGNAAPDLVAPDRRQASRSSRTPAPSTSAGRSRPARASPARTWSSTRGTGTGTATATSSSATSDGC